MPQTVTLQPLQNQTLQCQLGNQACTINVYQLAFGLFMDVFVGGQLVCAGIICLNATLIVRYSYLNFSGDFAFYDTQNITNPSDPSYSQLGTRFQLLYFSAAEIQALNLPQGIS